MPNLLNDYNPAATETPNENPSFWDFTIGEEPKELDADPTKLTIHTVFGRKGGAKNGELEDVSALQILNNPDLLGVAPGTPVYYKNGCPFAPASSFGMNAKGKSISIKCDGEWLNFQCTDPAHKHPSERVRQNKQGDDVWAWSIRNPQSTGMHGRKFLPFERGDHVECAQAIIRVLGDCAWDRGDKVRVFDANFRGKRKQPSPTAGTWVEASPDLIRKAIRDLAGEWIKEGTEAKPKYRKITLTHSAIEGIYNEVLSIARQDLKMGQIGPISKFENQSPRIVFKGSLYNISDDRLYGPEKMREFYVQDQEVLDVKYASQGGEPVMFIQFLKDVWRGLPDVNNRISFLQEWVGMALAGQVVSTENHLLLQGSLNGKNGKSRVVKIINEIFPSTQRTSLTFEDLENSFMLSALEHSRLNSYSDAKGTKVNASLVKTILSGDPLRADRKFKDSINMSSRAAWVVGINDNFTPSEQDTALFRRFTVLTFPRQFTAEEANHLIADQILEAEKALIILWAIEGLKRYRATQKWTDVPSSHEATRTWKINVNPLFDWFENQIEEVHGERAGILPRVHYEAYREWAKGGGRQPVSETKFGTMAASRQLSGRALIGGKQIRLHKVRIIEETDLSALRAEDLMGEM